jgi:hypothetical protein
LPISQLKMQGVGRSEFSSEVRAFSYVHLIYK